MSQDNNLDVLEVVQSTNGQFGLKRNDTFLSALPDGTICLTASHLLGWESFRVSSAPPQGMPRVAAITMVFNEPDFLPVWERHYSKQLGMENLYIIDHGTNDGSTETCRIPNRFKIPRDELDEGKRCRFVSALQASLLNYYDAVIFTDVDELVVADPARYADLRDYCRSGLDRFSTCLGFEILHYPEFEAPLDLAKSILAQRKFFRFSAHYSKPLLAEVPMGWVPGFHACQYPPRLDKDLFLFHLKLADRSIALRNLTKSRDIKWSESSISKRHGWQNRQTDDQFLTNMYPPAPHLSDAVIKEDFEEYINIFRKDTPGFTQTHTGMPILVPHRFASFIPADLPTPAAYLCALGPTNLSADFGIADDDIVVVDIGAAGGLKNGWAGQENKIFGVLFEPNPHRAAELRNNPGPFKKILVEEVALGAISEERTLRLTESSGCSSLLIPNEAVLAKYSVFPAFRIREELPIRTMPYIDLHNQGRVPAPDVVKIDVQGFEFEVLSGFGDLLSQVLVLEIESHLYPIYKDQKLFGDLIALLSGFGLVLRKISPVNHFDGDIVEIDAWFTISHERSQNMTDTRKKKLADISAEFGLPEHRTLFPSNAHW